MRCVCSMECACLELSVEAGFALPTRDSFDWPDASPNSPPSRLPLLDRRLDLECMRAA